MQLVEETPHYFLLKFENKNYKYDQITNVYNERCEYQGPFVFISFAYTLTPTSNATKYKFLENRSRYWFAIWYCLSHCCSLHMYVKIIKPWRQMSTLHVHIRVIISHYLQFFILHLRLYSFVCYFFESADFNKFLHGYLNMVLSKVLQFSNQ